MNNSDLKNHLSEVPSLSFADNPILTLFGDDPILFCPFLLLFSFYNKWRSEMSSEANVQSRISALEKILHQDPGKRGLQGIWDELLATGQLEKLYTMLPAAKSIANSCNKAIVVRFRPSSKKIHFPRTQRNQS